MYRPAHAAALVLGCLLAATSAAQPFALVPSPNVGDEDNKLTGIDYNAGELWAVGVYYDLSLPPAGQSRALALHWEDDAWEVVPTPLTHWGGNGFYDVAVVSETEVWAVGNSGSNGAVPLLLRWDGTAWEEIDLGFPHGGVLHGIHAFAPDDIWVTGPIANPDPLPEPPFISAAFHYDGSSWTRHDLPPVGALRSTVYDIDASGPDDVWVAGSWSDDYGEWDALAYRWDGSTWTAVLPPETGDTQLQGVAVLAPDDVWVTGTRLLGQHVTTHHWDGSGWTAVENPGGHLGLLGVASDEVYSLGGRIGRWDGSAWTVIDTLQEVDDPSLRRGVRLPDGTVWAVGRDFGITQHGNVLRTLSVRRDVAAVAVSAEPAAPPVVIPANGGSFQFTVTLTNTSSQSQTFQAWTAVTGLVGREPVLSPRVVTLVPGASLTRTLTQQVPGTAPGGTYTYHVRIGAFGGTVLASDAFTFTKEGGEVVRTAVAPGAGAWSVSGWEDVVTASASAGLPDGFALSEASPNPFTGTARLTLELAKAQAVRVEVFDALGRRVAVLLDGEAEAGTHALVLDASGLPAGVYVVRVTGEAFTVTRRAVYAR